MFTSKNPSPIFGAGNEVVCSFVPVDPEHLIAPWSSSHSLALTVFPDGSRGLRLLPCGLVAALIGVGVQPRTEYLLWQNTHASPGARFGATPAVERAPRAVRVYSEAAR